MQVPNEMAIFLSWAVLVFNLQPLLFHTMSRTFSFSFALSFDVKYVYFIQQVLEEFKRTCQALSEKLGNNKFFINDR